MTEAYFPDLAADFRLLLERVRSQRVVVIGHMRPDGDCIGSQVALVRVLRGLGVDAVAVNRHPVPVNLEPFVGDTPFYVLGEGFEPQGRVAINVDCADPIRVSRPLLDYYPQTLANIDHHRSNPGYGEINIIDADSAATCEILAGLFFDHQLPVDAVTAQALYVGIATDTGQFRFPSTTVKVFEIAAELIRCGASPSATSASLYENRRFEELSLLQVFLNSLQLELNGRLCVGMLRVEDYARTGATREESEGLVDYARDISGVQVGLLLEAFEDGMLKGSLRAKNPLLRVDEIARRFNGGGHACAAGFNLNLSIADFYPQIVKVVGERLLELDAAAQSAPAAKADTADG